MVFVIDPVLITKSNNNFSPLLYYVLHAFVLMPLILTENVIDSMYPYCWAIIHQKLFPNSLFDFSKWTMLIQD